MAEQPALGGRDLRTPDGCAWCGVAEREHAGRWARPVGRHRWVAPTDAQRKARMTARRNNLGGDGG